MDCGKVGLTRDEDLESDLERSTVQARQSALFSLRECHDVTLQPRRILWQIELRINLMQV
jgi:hypothetical protein